MWEELYEAHCKELISYGTHMDIGKELTEDLVPHRHHRVGIGRVQIEF